MSESIEIKKSELNVICDAVIDTYYSYNDNGADYCCFCNAHMSYYKKPCEDTHKTDCPVLLATELKSKID